ncbi:hypothetical protein U1Q18_050265 [Sarracenia purpurea var. burkii]
MRLFGLCFLIWVVNAISLNDTSDNATSLDRRVKRETNCSSYEVIYRGAPGVVVNYDSGLSMFAQSSFIYYVMNMGRTRLKLDYKFGAFSPTEEGHELGPGEDIAVMDSSSVTESRVKIENLSRDKVGYAFVKRHHTVCFNWKTGGQPPEISAVDWNKLAKKVTVSLSKQIPQVGSVVSPLVDYFWPDKDVKVDVWSQVEAQVRHLVDDSYRETMKDTMKSLIAGIRTRMKNFESEMVRKKETPKLLQHHYMNIAQDLAGLQSKFVSSNNAFKDFAGLPYYSMAVLMKVWFYTIGITHRQNLGLTDDNVADFVEYRKKTLAEAETLLPKLFAARLDAEYNAGERTSQAYYNFVDIRNVYSKYGSEYLKMMKMIVANELSVRWNEIYFLGYDHRYQYTVVMQRTNAAESILRQRWCIKDNSHMVGVCSHAFKWKPTEVFGRRAVILRRWPHHANSSYAGATDAMWRGRGRELVWDGGSEFVLSSMVFDRRNDVLKFGKNDFRDNKNLKSTIHNMFESDIFHKSTLLLAYRRAKRTMSLSDIPV